MMIRCALACCMALLVAAGDPEESNETQLHGRLVPAEAVVIDLWLEAYRDELLVLEAAENGSFVNEGDVLIRFDTRRIDEQIRQADFDFDQAQARLAASEVEAQLAAAVDRDALARVEKEAEWAQRQLAGYLEREKAFKAEDVRLREQSSRHGLEDQRDELDQLEKMYREDELVDATEEIVLKRARRRLAASTARAKLRTDQSEHQMALAEALKQERLELEAEQKREAHDRKRLSVALAAQRREREQHKAHFGLQKDRERITRLHHDREKLLVRAPVSGLVIHGDPEKPPGDGRLDRGSRASLFKTLMVVADPDRLEVVVDVPESSLVLARANPMADITVSAAPDFVTRGRARVAYLATGRKGEENLYRARIVVQDSDPRLRPGMRCTVVLLSLDDGGIAVRDPGQ